MAIQLQSQCLSVGSLLQGYPATMRLLPAVGNMMPHHRHIQGESMHLINRKQRTRYDSSIIAVIGLKLDKLKCRTTLSKTVIIYDAKIEPKIKNLKLLLGYLTESPLPLLVWKAASS